MHERIVKTNRHLTKLRKELRLVREYGVGVCPELYEDRLDRLATWNKQDKLYRSCREELFLALRINKWEAKEPLLV